MNCPDWDELEQLATDSVSSAESSGVAEHVSSCDQCRLRLDAVRQNLAVAGSVKRALERGDGQPTVSVTQETIGPYRIRRQIGRGGMGLVYEAEQQSPRRLVALKVLGVALHFDEHYQRLFRRESQALARLKHPNIAAIYEAGQTADGRSFFAMELVEGAPLLEFARRADLPLRKRLALFKEVCDAIAYAHQRGVIHRDLKPSNILVDRTGRPKVLDFGLAKMLDVDPHAPAVTAVTEVGRIQGTLPYMSPEQVQGQTQDVDTRTDVYSLGVVLYELLLARPPYAVASTKLVEAVRAICEQVPVRPSAIDQRTRGDLETILLKALEKVPGRRYESAGAFRDDLDRFLTNQPILARSPSTVYQFRKLVARHRVPMALVGVILFLILAAGPTMGWLYAQAEGQRRLSEKAAAKAVAVNDFLQSLLSMAMPSEAGPDITVRESLEVATDRLESEALDDQPELEFAVRGTIGRAFASLGDAVKAEKHFATALQLPAAAGDPEERVLMRLSLADALRDQGRHDESEAVLEELYSQLKRTSGFPDRLFLSTLSDLIHVRLLAGREGEAHELLPEAMALSETLGKPGSGAASDIAAIADALLTLHQVDAAEPLYRRAIAMFEEGPGKPHPDWVTAVESLNLLLRFEQRYEEAAQVGYCQVELSRRTFGANHQKTARSLGALVMDLVPLERYEEAEVPAREALAIFEQRTPDLHQERLNALANLAIVLRGAGRMEEAEAGFRAAAEMSTRLLGDEALQTLKLRVAWGEVLLRLGRTDEAEVICSACGEIVNEHHPDDARLSAGIEFLFGEVRAARGQFSDAEPLLLAAWGQAVERADLPEYRRRHLIRRLAEFYDRWAADGSAEAAVRARDWREKLDR